VTVSRRTILIVMMAGFAFVLAIPALVGFAANWLWYAEIGYEVVYGTRITTGGLLFALAGALAFAALYLNLRYAQRGLVPDPIVVRLTPVAPALDITDRVRRLAFPISAALGFLIGVGAAGNWLLVQRALHAVPFNIADPIFGHGTSASTSSRSPRSTWGAALLFDAASCSRCCSSAPLYLAARRPDPAAAPRPRGAGGRRCTSAVLHRRAASRSVALQHLVRAHSRNCSIRRPGRWSA
jgi:hypothetical protein